MTAVRKAYRFLALSLAALLLTTSVNCIIDMHYCGGKLVSMSLFGEAKRCAQAGSSMEACRMSDDHQLISGEQQAIDRKNCCRDGHLRIQLDQDQKQETYDRASDTEDRSFSVFTAILPNRAIFEYQLLRSPTAHAPPDLQLDLRLLGQTFLL